MKIENLLCSVSKPARYAGGELNMVKKEFAGRTSFALAFPDIYEVGMSHLGSRILYHIINSREDALCERVFLPWPDMQESLKNHGAPLFTLENRMPLGDFDIVGFTLQYEMNYAGVLKMLSLAGIPFYAAARGKEHPLVIGGGPCAFNPEPLAPFFDLFVIGDGEEVIETILDIYRQWKSSGGSKEELLAALCRVDGVYVPSFYDVQYNSDGSIRSIRKNRPFAPDRVKKAIVKNIDAAPYPTSPIVPFLPIVHDRMVLEVFRGCTRGCRFCQAGFIYRPVRERRMGTLISLAEKMHANTGYDEISLSSLSTGDYSELPKLVSTLSEYFEPRHVSLSMPSLRLGADISGYGESATRMRRAGLTIAPEAGSQILRDRINKNVREEDLVKTASEALALGWNGIKLYFMIGLPFETQEDISCLAELIKRTRDLCQKGAKSAERARVRISLASFVPKPFTPFQWCAQEGMETLIEKQNHISSLIGRKAIELDWHDADTSFLEAVLARGDRRLAGVLAEAAARGNGLDAWREYFDKDAWDQAFRSCGVSPKWYANRERALDEMLPYDHIDAGISKAYLVSEYEKAKSGVTTPDCRQGCTGCGLTSLGACCQ
ncbi:MAG: TIGR03960 family B12-binding radical SAM protein [Bacillota bacterium]|nr:TIGR03960 family B12-binding radical SAM protein [Bacillota bacterium]